VTEVVTCESLDGGALWHVRLATPKANILDRAKIAALTGIYQKARDARDLKAVVLEGDGPHFSFGASVEEHMPGQYEEMIPAFHELLKTMVDSLVPTIASVRGQCLGGGLEIALATSRIFVSPDAMFGQPEIILGVFAPIASILLTERVGRGAAEHICLTGRSLDAAEAFRVGLVDEIADDPTEAAITYARSHLLPHSASSLRLAMRALRADLSSRFHQRLQDTEELYLEELMATEDAVEGLRAFLEKREPEWSNR